jgi:KDO2-lipid IV(A) lauroyltransferase
MTERPPLSPRHWPTWAGIAAGVVIGRLPWRMQLVLGPPLGRLLRIVLGRRANVARINLQLCFPELDEHARAQLLAEHFDALGMCVFEFLRAWWGRIPTTPDLYTIQGLEHYQSAHAQGRGVILVSAHFTTLELCMRLLAGHVALSGMYRPHEQPAMEWAVKRARLRYVHAMFSRDELRPAIRHLKQGGTLWFAPDQETRRGDSVFVPFFGQPAWSLTSTHQLARLSGAAVLPCFHRRLANGHYELEIGPPLADFPGPDATVDTARIMALIESLIRREPAQYLWLHKRFKRRPEGGPSPYD